MKVKCVDFCTWLRKRIDPSSELILKFDIEGAEYAVLNKMLDENIFDDYNITKLLIEWHYHKIGLSEEKHNELVNDLPVLIEPWSATSGPAIRLLRKDPIYAKILRGYRG